MTKKEILQKLAQNLNTYESALWLGKANKKLDNQTPAELMAENKIEQVAEILESEIKRLKRK